MSAFRFVHIPDFHARPDARNADRYAALDQILAAEQDVACWLWPGDLNDARMSIEDRNALAERLLRMAHLAPVVIAKGNHDVPGDLDIFGRLNGVYPIIVVHDARTIRVQLASAPTPTWASVFVLPYPDKATLVAKGVANGQVVNDAADLLEPTFMLAAHELDEAQRRGDVTLMIGHVNVAGSLTSSGQPNIGREIELSPRHLDRLGDIPKLLNHIHKPQSIAGAHYAGSICRLNWGEIEAKSYIVLTLRGGEDAITRVPLNIAPMFHIEGELTREGFIVALDPGPVVVDRCDEQQVLFHDEGAGAIAPREPAPWLGGDVRVRVRFKQSEKAMLDFESVRRLFAGARRVELEPIAVSDRALRAPEVVAAVTTEAKLAAYARRPLTEREREKLDALEHGCHMKLLEAVETLAADPAPEPAPAPAEPQAVTL